jgi:hypothetical protein
MAHERQREKGRHCAREREREVVSALERERQSVEVKISVTNMM